MIDFVTVIDLLELHEQVRSDRTPFAAEMDNGDVLGFDTYHEAVAFMHCRPDCQIGAWIEDDIDGWYSGSMLRLMGEANDAGFPLYR